MKTLDIIDRILDTVSAIRPLDDTERQHIDFVLKKISFDDSSQWKDS